MGKYKGLNLLSKKEGVLTGTSIEDDAMDDLICRNIVYISLGVKVKKRKMIGRAYHLQMDYSMEDLNDTYLYRDQIQPLLK